MRSKGVSVRLTSAEEVQASVQTFGPKVAGLLDERVESPPEVGPPFSHQQVFDYLDGDLGTARLVLVEAEDDHVRQQVVISKLQRKSDQLASELYDQQVAVRKVFGGLFGSELGFELAAISGNTPRGRKDLEEQVDQTIKLLKDPAVEMPELKVRKGIEIDFGSLAEGLEAGKTELGNARSELLLARKAGVQTMLVKHAAMTEFDRVFPATAGTLEGFFRLVGEVELADRIRTSIRRVTSRGAVEDEDVPAEETQPTDGESGGGEPDAPSESEPESPASGDPETEPAEPASSPA